MPTPEELLKQAMIDKRRKEFNKANRRYRYPTEAVEAVRAKALTQRSQQ